MYIGMVTHKRYSQVAIMEQDGHLIGERRLENASQHLHHTLADDAAGGRRLVDLIDDQGRLFGLVNVIDALAVLLALAVVVAGVAFVDPFPPPTEETSRYATVDLGTQPRYHRAPPGGRRDGARGHRQQPHRHRRVPLPHQRRATSPSFSEPGLKGKS